MLNLMSLIDSATKTTGTCSANADPRYDSYVWQSPATLFEHQPTVRLDYNLTDNHRLYGSWTQITAKRTPDYLNNARLESGETGRVFRTLRKVAR